MTMLTRMITATETSLTEVGFGCASIAGLYRACSEEAAQETLELAWQSGIRYFDTAPFYGAGLSEERLGRFLQTKARADYAISTKVGRLLRPVSPSEAPDYGFIGGNPCVVEYDYSGAGIRRSIEASRHRTGLDHFDIVFIHDIGIETHGADRNKVHLSALVGSGFAELEAMKAEGIIGAWGLGVNEVEICLTIMDHVRLHCILLAGRYTLLDRSAEASLLSRCAELGTGLVVGGIFNSGILATGPVPGAHFNYQEASADIKERVAMLEKIAIDSGRDLASLALQFPLRNPQVVSLLLGSSNPESLRRNLLSLEPRVPKEVFDACTVHTIGH